MELVWLPRHGSDLRTDAHTKKSVRICAGGMASEHKKDERSEKSGGVPSFPRLAREGVAQPDATQKRKVGNPLSHGEGVNG